VVALAALAAGASRMHVDLEAILDERSAIWSDSVMLAMQRATHSQAGLVLSVAADAMVTAFSDRMKQSVSKIRHVYFFEFANASSEEIDCSQRQSRT